MPVLSLTRMNMPWTTTELQLLRERYPYDDLNVLAHELGRTKSAIQYQASSMRIARAGARRFGAKGIEWTRADDAMIREHYPAGDIAALAERMGRTDNSIMKRAKLLGVRRKGREAVAEAPPPVFTVACVDRPSEYQVAARKRQIRDATEALIEHGVDEVAAELATGLIVHGRVPGVRFEV